MWVVLIVAMRTFAPPEVVYAGAMSATVPLWFLAVYITLTAMAPQTHAWWRRIGPITILVPAAAAVGVDIARFAFDVPGISWVNFLFVWATVHQIGYWWADEDDAGGVPARRGWAIAGTSLAALIAVTWVGWYPVAMVGVPGAGVTNMTPPTFAIALLGVMQLGIILGTQPAVRRFTARARAWHVVVAVSGVIMTLYLWHLSAMSLVAATGLFTFDGALFKIEPGTGVWWASRPVWLMILLICLAVTFMTEVTSNTATASLLMPLLAAASVAMEINPFLLMIPAALSASCAFMLPVATAPNAVIYGSGRVSIKDMARAGLVLNLFGAVVISVVSYLFFA